jgi:hypothetical protein
MQEPRELHWRFLKRLMKYVNTTRDFSLTFQKGKETKINLIGFTDSDYATSLDDRKSNSAYVFKYNNFTISWNSAKQKTVSLSLTKAEYIALTSAVKEAVWLKQLLVELSRKSEKINIYCDNNSTICLANNSEFNTRTKHIDIRYHYIREAIVNNSISVVHVPTEENIADVLTKG